MFGLLNHKLHISNTQLNLPYLGCPTKLATNAYNMCCVSGYAARTSHYMTAHIASSEKIED
jgi:hypothetical protein